MATKTNCVYNCGAKTSAKSGVCKGCKDSPAGVRVMRLTGALWETQRTDAVPTACPGCGMEFSLAAAYGNHAKTDGMSDWHGDLAEVGMIADTKLYSLDGKLIDGIRRHMEVCVEGYEPHEPLTVVDAGRLSLDADTIFRLAKAGYDSHTPTQRAVLGVLYQREVGVTDRQAIAYSGGRSRIHGSAKAVIRWLEEAAERISDLHEADNWPWLLRDNLVRYGVPSITLLESLVRTDGWLARVPPAKLTDAVRYSCLLDVMRSADGEGWVGMPDSAVKSLLANFWQLHCQLELEPELDAELAPVAQPEPEPELDAELAPVAQPEPEPELDAELAPVAQPEPEPELDAELAPVAQPEPEPELDAELAPVAQPEPEPEPELDG